MTDRPLSFSAPMVRALLDGSKTQTRRVLKYGNHCPNSCVVHDGVAMLRNTHTGIRQDVRLPYDPGDRLWVKEAWRTEASFHFWPPRDLLVDSPVWFIADGTRRGRHNDQHGRYRHARFMPRWASRLTLTVTDVRVQRLQDISEADAIAEGLSAITKDGTLVKYGIPDRDGLPGTDDHGWPWDRWSASPVNAYRVLWNSLHGPDAWDANPWVAAVTFTVRQGNIDERTEATDD